MRQSPAAAGRGSVMVGKPLPLDRRIDNAVGFLLVGARIRTHLAMAGEAAPGGSDAEMGFRGYGRLPPSGFMVGMNSLHNG